MKKKYKVLHVILSKKYSGSEKYVNDLINYQSKFHNVSVVILKQNLYFDSLISKKITKFKISNYFKKISLNNIIKRYEPNIIHTHLGEATKLISRSINYKIISTLHMNYKHKYYKNCDAIIVSNSTQYLELSKIFTGKIYKSYLWVNIKKPKKNSKQIKRFLKIPSKHKIIGSIGRFHPQKGFDIILSCFKKANPKNTTLVLIGNDHDKYLNEIKNFKNIILKGHVDNVSDYYKIFDVAIFASRWETFGFSLIEAMKFNLPIISSTHIGNRDWIKDYKITKISLNNLPDITNKILSISKTKIKKQKYNINKFSYIENCKKISNIYSDLLK